MPFTVSHVAAVLPGHRWLVRWRLLCAAVIGSMVPDFGMFMPWGLRRWETHSFMALFTFCLPVGLIAYWVTELLIKPAVTEILPNRAYLRLRDSPPTRPISEPLAWLLAALAILAGAITHLVWDGFTHEGARGVRMVPMLAEYGPDMVGHSVRLYRWLQHGSSVAGLLVVLVAMAVWRHHAPRPTTPPARRLGALERWVWTCVCLGVPLVVLLVRLAVPMLAGQPLLASSYFIEDIVIATMRAAVGTLLATSLLLQIRLWRATDLSS